MAPSLKAALLGCAIAISSLFGNAEARPACYPMPQVEEMAQKYKELPVSYGKAEGGVDPYHLGQRGRQDLDGTHGVAGWQAGLHHSGCPRDRVGSGRTGR
jgi:hypothetical protein